MQDTWRGRLEGQMRADWAQEIDEFEQYMGMRRQGKVPEKVFAEMRLRRGAYGQRYDNGQRNDGKQIQTLRFPNLAMTKGPTTLWDAPGMMRIKIPSGALTPIQLEVMADLADEYSDAICHITTRQDIQLHYIHIDDTPDLMRRLAAVGITTREACGNSVRNVTACPIAGVCCTESFDTTHYAYTMAYYLLGHPDAQDFGRKFKIAFSGCEDKACALTSFHDLGYIAKTRVVDGKTQRGFAFYVGGGLGSVPAAAELFDPFLPQEELLPMAQAVCRVFGRLGEKNNRARARMKFVVMKLGIEEFRRQVLEERAKLSPDPRWHEFLKDLGARDEKPTRPASQLPASAGSEAFRAWRRTNTEAQKQAGYVAATISCPLGDLSSEQTRALARLARTYSGNAVRLTVEQNAVMRWVSESDLPALHAELERLGLAEASAGTIIDITACPGTDTCKLGHSSSRGLAGELRTQLAALNTQMDDAVKKLHIKVSGCFNSCSQHHVADLGFYGVGRKVKGYMVPHFQVILGGEWTHNGGAYGLAIGAVPSKNIPAAVLRLTRMYAEGRTANESFQEFIKRVGKAKVKQALDELTRVPAHDVDASFYSDWRDPREYGTGDIGIGECAGEVISPTEFDLATSERQAFDALSKLDAGDYAAAMQMGFDAMLTAAKGLLKMQGNPPSDPDAVVRSFRERFHDTHVFDDPFAGAKFAQYFFRQHEQRVAATENTAHQCIEEAQLFIEATYACYARVSTPVPAAQPAAAEPAGGGA